MLPTPKGGGSPLPGNSGGAWYLSGSRIRIADAITRTSNTCRRELILMPTEFHLTDQELLQSADGELPSRRTAQIRAHLACLLGLSRTNGRIGGSHRRIRASSPPDSRFQLPPIAGPRALLRVRLAELASKPKASSWRQFVQFIFAQRGCSLPFPSSYCCGLGGWPAFPPMHHLALHQTHRLFQSSVGSFQILTSRRAPRAGFR